MARPRAFDVEDALDAATRTFWAHGYEATTVAMLCEAAGVNRPSLYAAFGSKDELFYTVIDRYHAGPAAAIGRALDQPSIGDVARGMLAAAIDLHTGKDRPHGCLAITSVLSCKDPRTRDVILQDRVQGRAALNRRLRRAIAEGELAAACDVDLLAHYLQTAISGIAVEAAIGASRTRLQQIADLATRAIDHEVGRASRTD